MKDDKKDLKGYIQICNTKLYQLLREKLAIADFELVDGEKWHRTDLTDKSLKGVAYIMPDRGVLISSNHALKEHQEAMRDKTQALVDHGDLAVDVFDIITAKWLKEAKHHENMIDITVDEILLARGIKKKINSSGRRGGYSLPQRNDIQKMVDALSHTWISIFEMVIYQKINNKRQETKWKGESKAIVLSSRFGKCKEDGSVDDFAWRVRPGDAFAKFLFDLGRQTALLSQKALNYDPYRQKWEKRLTRYFVWLWRISEVRCREGLLVETLLRKAGMEIDKSRPGRTKARLEKALNRLQSDGVITSWEYEIAEDRAFRKYFWREEWLKRKVIITAPAEVIEQYKKFKDMREK